MVEKLKDAANFLKAKIRQDELEQILIAVTSEDNWQASTKELHEVANAAHNYEKWQKINEFIWEKLRKSKSWKKIMKTLTLVQFLLKNGPPSILSSFKYEVYHFRSFDTFSAYSQGVDRGEAIREKSKVIVQLLSNEELLEQERVKAKNIRQKMAGVVGDKGMHYGGYQGSSDHYQSKYQSYNSKTYDGNTLMGSQDSNGLGTYGDYNYGKSTLDKYKDPSKKNTMNISKPEPTTQNRPNDIQEPTSDTKKPFERIAPKLVKPGLKPAPKIDSPIKKSAEQKPTKNVGSILDEDEFFGITKNTTSSTPNLINNSNNIFEIMPTSSPPTNTSLLQPNYNQLPFTNNAIPQVQQPLQQPVQQPVQQSVQQPVQQNYNQQGFNFAQPNQFPNQYSQPNQFTQPYHQFPNAQYGVTQVGYIQNQYYNTPQIPQNNFGVYGNQPNFPVQSPNLAGQTFNQPQNPINLNKNVNQGITLSTKTKDEDDFGGFQSAKPNSQNVKWMTSQQKNLTDFSDFSSQIKKETTPKSGNKNSNNNNIQIDAWNW